MSTLAAAILLLAIPVLAGAIALAVIDRIGRRNRNGQP